MNETYNMNNWNDKRLQNVSWKTLMEDIAWRTSGNNIVSEFIKLALDSVDWTQRDLDVVQSSVLSTQ
jgi:hypothetical protein